MNKQSKGSLQPVYAGFLNISHTERGEYLKYLELAIERQTDRNEKRRLARFKAKLEKEFTNAEV